MEQSYLAGSIAHGTCKSSNDKLNRMAHNPTRYLSSRSSRLAFALALALVGIVLVFLVGTPFVIRALASQWLLDNGGDQVRVGDVDFNPFTGELLFEDAEVLVGQQALLQFDLVSLDVAWWPLINNRIAVQAAELTGLQLVVDNRRPDALLIGSVALPKVPTASSEATAAPWFYGVESLTLHDAVISLLDERASLEVVVDVLNIDSFSTWLPEEATGVEFSGSINGAAVDLEGSATPLAEKSIYTADLTIEELPLEAFERLLPAGFSKIGGRLSYDGGIEVSQAQGALDAAHSGSATLESFTLHAADPAIAVRNRSWTVSGEVSFSQAEASPVIDAALDVAFEQLEIDSSMDDATLIKLGALDIEELVLQRDRSRALSVTAKEIALTDLALGDAGLPDEQLPQIAAQEILIVQSTLANRELTVDTIRYSGFHNRVTRTESGDWQILSYLNMLQRLAQPAGTAASDTAQDVGEVPSPLLVSIDRFELNDEAIIEISDQYVTPPFRQTLTIEDLTVDSLSTRPDAQDSTIALKGRMGAYSEIALTGTVESYLPPVSFELASDIKTLDVPTLSSYARDSLGVTLDSGTLDSHAELSASAGRLDGNVELALHQLEVKTLPGENGLQSEIPVPLNVALNTLRDTNNTIELEIPISGNLASPDFDVGDAIGKGLASGLQKGALTYLTFALQPYGALISIARIAGEKMSKLHLEPVVYQPGQSELTSQHQDYLSKIANVLADRPNIKIKVCGVAARADQDLLQSQSEPEQLGDSTITTQTPATSFVAELETLAVARAAGVRDHLVTEHQISPSRLATCLPRVAVDQPQAEPQTSLLI
jgi:hypothetical protein